MKYGYQERLEMHMQLLSFTLHCPRTGDRHERMVFSKAILRNWNLAQQHTFRKMFADL